MCIILPFELIDALFPFQFVLSVMSMQILRERWTSVARHVTNQHDTFEENHTFTECEHPPLSEEDRADIKWLQAGSPAHKALYEVVNEPALLRDLSHLSRFKHTGNLTQYINTLYVS